MPEPERDIEKTLRAYAKKRGEEAGAPVEMHPATRKLLHGEIARLRGKARDKSSYWTRVFGSSWPQIALRVSVLMLLTSTAAFFFLPFLSKPKSELATLRPRDKQFAAQKQSDRKEDVSKLEDLSLAKTDGLSGAVVLNGNEPAPRSRSASAGEARFAVPPAAPPVSSLEKDKFKADTVNSANKPLPESPQIASGAFGSLATKGAANPPSPARDITQEYSDNISRPTGAVATAPAPTAAAAPANGQPNSIALANSSPTQPALPPLAAPVIPSGNLVATDHASQAMNLDALNAPANSVTQQFLRTIQPGKARRILKSPAKVVLNSFRVEQTGNQIRMIDSDGSVYSGSMELAAEGAKSSIVQTKSFTVSGVAQANAVVTEKSQREQNKPLGINGASGSIPPIQNYLFHVGGTNLSLHLPVVFSGSFIAGVQLQPSAKMPVGNGLMANTTQIQTAGQAPLQLLNSQLRGRAVIGTNQIEINALPVKP